MVVVPEEIPPTMPVAAPTVPIAGAEDCHVPPPELANAVVRPMHTDGIPVIGAGVGFTVTVMVRKQPEGIIYVTDEVPAEMPVNTPVAGSMVPTVGALLDHAPPASALVSVVVDSTHTVGVPPILNGWAFTVIVSVTIQPVDSL